MIGRLRWWYRDWRAAHWVVVARRRGNPMAVALAVQMAERARIGRVVRSGP
ncbi:MAG TPA: hypothetical protein VGH66_03280 [Acidimicrobiales bacterium]|jgi:hypothetical protein